MMRSQKIDAAIALLEEHGYGVVPPKPESEYAKANPLAFLVFAHDDDLDYLIFVTEKDAIDFAQEQEEKADSPEGSWPIYPLWASDQLSRE